MGSWSTIFFKMEQTNIELSTLEKNGMKFILKDERREENR